MKQHDENVRPIRSHRVHFVVHLQNTVVSPQQTHVNNILLSQSQRDKLFFFVWFYGALQLLLIRCIPPPTVPEYVDDKWSAFRFHYTPSVSTILSLTHAYILLLHTYILFQHTYIFLLHIYITYSIKCIHDCMYMRAKCMNVCIKYMNMREKCINVCVQIYKYESENI